MNYYIADPHFSHNNIIRYCNRPFSSIDEMDATLVANWNERIKDDDTVYIIGDMFFRLANINIILSSLKGKKILIRGNHDKVLTSAKYGHYFESMQDYLFSTADHVVGIAMSHYPMLSWDKQVHGSYHIYGHIHDRWDPSLASVPRALNAGVDINGFKPVTLKELIKNNERWRLANS